MESIIHPISGAFLMIKFRFFALAAVLAATALIAAGCGESGTATANNTGASVVTEAAAMKEDAAMKAEEKMKATAAMKEDAAMKAKAAGKMTPGDTLKTGKTSFGKIVQDKKGLSIYLFTKEGGKKSECYGECAKAWPPVIVSGTPKARSGSGISASKLGTTTRKNGKLQATYNGHPLYYYVGETKANQVLCQAVDEFGGTWFVVNPNGTANKSS